MQKAVALTFDDGPDPWLTPLLLDTLAESDAKASFFFIGSKAAGAPDIVSRAISEGHEVGIHMWNDKPTRGLHLEEFRADLGRTAAVLEAAGAKPRRWRPASGWYRPGQLQEARDRGFVLTLGSIMPRDLRIRDVDRELRYILRRVQPGSIIVLHEGDESRMGVVQLTERLIAELGTRGFRILTVGGLQGEAER